MKLSSLSSLVLAIGAFAPFASAGLVTGRVVDALGNGVPGVNLNARDVSGSGGDADLLNDGTDANGYFSTTFPAGNFTVEFVPPQPPASTSVITYVTPVNVTALGTTALGDVVLTPGWSISGRITNPLGVGVAGLNLDVLDANGNNVDLAFDGTNATGNFAFAAPAGSTALRIDPSGLVGQVLAPQEITLALASNVDLGTLQLAQGFVVSALVRGPTAAAVANCDVDVFDPVTGAKRYTPGDSSNASGFVDFVVPAGTWNIDFCAPFALHLAAKRVVQSVAATTSLGVQTLATGAVMSGVLRDCSGAALSGGNVDLRDTATQAELPVCNDGVSASGTYQCIVPFATVDVVFKPSASAGLANDVHAGVSVTTNFVLDGILGPAFDAFCFGDGTGTPCPCGNASAIGAKAGCLNSLAVGGKISAQGRACLSDDTMRLVGSNMPNSSALYFQGTTQSNAGLGNVFGDGLRCAGGSVIRLGTKTNAAGGSTYPVGADLAISVRGLVPGAVTRTYQIWYRNAAAFCNPETFNLTNGIRVVWAL